MAKAPKVEEEVEPCDVPKIQRLLEAAARRRNGARWALALALGLRQGEARRGPGQGHDTYPPLPAAPQVHTRLRRDLGQDTRTLPQRQATRPATGGVKSKAGRRAIGLPPPLVALLRTHQAEQQHERATARQLWHDEGWRLLREAGLREGRLHDARHTAAIVLLVLRQPTPTVMSLMGWSSESVTVRYQHVTDTMRSQVGELIWDSAAGNDDQATLVVHRGSLAAVLAAVEECLATHRGGTGQRPGLLAAIADLRGALPPATAAPE